MPAAKQNIPSTLILRLPPKHLQSDQQQQQQQQHTTYHIPLPFTQFSSIPFAAGAAPTSVLSTFHSSHKNAISKKVQTNHQPNKHQNQELRIAPARYKHALQTPPTIPRHVEEKQSQFTARYDSGRVQHKHLQRAKLPRFQHGHALRRALSHGR